MHSSLLGKRMGKHQILSNEAKEKIKLSFVGEKITLMETQMPALYYKAVSN